MKLLKKIILSLLAFPISSFVIFMIYCLIYIFLGKQYYIAEINNISNIYMLLKEFLVIGISLYIAILSFMILKCILENNNQKNITKLIYIIILALMITVLPICIIKSFFNSNIIFHTTFIILWLIIISSTSLILALKDFIDVWIINKKLILEKNEKTKI